jgi:hypothetical protein
MLCRRGCLLPGRMLARLWISGGCFVAFGSLATSLVDALLPRVCWPVSWRMLCRRGRSVRWRMLCRRCCFLLVLWVDALPPRLGILRRKPLLSFYCRHSGRSMVLRAVALSLSLYLFFHCCCSYVYTRLLTTILVVCNLCYEGSLIADL